MEKAKFTHARKIYAGGGSEFWPQIQFYQNRAGRRLLSFRSNFYNRKRGERLLAFASDIYE